MDCCAPSVRGSGVSQTCVSFVIPTETVPRMSRESVYLDVFGAVRWTKTTEVVEGSSPWSQKEVAA